MQISAKNKQFNLPVFFPDATHAVVKCLDHNDLSAAKVQGLVINTYHVLADETLDKISRLGGIDSFMKFTGPIISDSGGFQAMSLVRKNPANGHLTNNGVMFKIDGSGRKIYLTPKKCIETQLALGSDIVMCFDDCTDPTEALAEQELSVKRTVTWAQRCKDTFTELTKDVPVKPLIFAIIQGGNHKELRQKCAQQLVNIGFDGYAYGGWPVMNSLLLEDILEYTAHLMPDDKPKYAMGVGKPEDIVKCTKYGYNMFDCVLPTRDARHKRLYVFDETRQGLNFGYVHISSGKYELDQSPISNVCDCYTCKNHSKAYLHHLFKVTDPVAYRLATIHNLRFYSMLMEKLAI
jgi:queuine tRNA-ribosyltransferase